jgi:hypothetical protein
MDKTLENVLAIVVIVIAILFLWAILSSMP